MKGLPPKIELDEMTSEDLMKLPKEDLEIISFKIRKWNCKCKKCKRYTRARDYGILPMIWYHCEWINVNTTALFCAKHWKIRNRLIPIYGKESFDKKFLDHTKEPFLPL